jgi:hypothetical protein
VDTTFQSLRPNGRLQLTAHLSEAAGSLRSPAAFFIVRRSFYEADLSRVKR